MKKVSLITLIFLSTLFSQENIKDFQNLTLEQLLDVKVTVASKVLQNLEESPGIITIINKNEIEKFYSDNLGDVLSKITGSLFLSANILTDNIISFRAQAITPYNNQILILVNGRPVRDPITGGLNNVVYNSFPLEIIKRIEIIRGPGSVLYGSCAFSGVINIVTENSDEFFNASINYSSFNGFGQSVAFIKEFDGIGVTIGVKHFKDDGPAYKFTDYLNQTAEAKFNRENFGLYTRIDYNKLVLNTNYFYYNPFALSGDENSWDLLSPYDNSGQNHFMADLSYEFQINNKINIKPFFTFNYHKWNQDGKKSIIANDYLFEANIEYRPVKTASIIGGISFSFDDYKGENILAGQRNNFSGFAQIQKEIFDNTSLIAGLQVNKIENIDANISPRIGIIGKFSDSWGYKFLYSKAFRKAYPLETSFNVPAFKGNPLLSPELIQTTELQIFVNKSNIQSSFTIYYSKITDIITRVRVKSDELASGFYINHINSGEFNFGGIEFENKIYLLNTDLLLTFNYTYQINENGNGLKNAALHPNHITKLGILYQNDIGSIGLFSSYYSKPYDISILYANDPEYFPGKYSINKNAEDFLNISFKIRGDLFKILKIENNNKLILSLEGNNILNKDVRYPEFTSKGINTLIPIIQGSNFGISLGYNFSFN